MCKVAFQQVLHERKDKVLLHSVSSANEGREKRVIWSGNKRETN
jgi:hypothetical protein